MNKLTRELVYQIAVQGKDKKQWDLVQKVFGFKETRRPWEKWIQYHQFYYDMGQTRIFEISGQGYHWGLSNVSKGWSIHIGRDRSSPMIPSETDQIIVRLHDTALPGRTLMSLIFTGPQTESLFPDWLPFAVSMINQMARCYDLYIGKTSGGNKTRIQQPEDLEPFLSRNEPKVLQEIVRAILDSGLDFYPEPILQILKTCQGLGINYKP